MERKLTLRNHAELFASELSDISNKLGELVVSVGIEEDEEGWLDLYVYNNMKELCDKISEATSLAWQLENDLAESDMGKRRF